MKLTILGGKDTLVGETLRASSEVNEKLPGKLFLRDLYGSLRIIFTFGLLEMIPVLLLLPVSSVLLNCCADLSDTSFKQVLLTKRKTG